MADSSDGNIRSILSAPAAAMSAKQILVMTFFLCLGMALYQAGTYLAYVADGQQLAPVYHAYGLLTFGYPALIEQVSWVVWSVAVGLGLLAVMLGLFAVSAIQIENIRGNRFLSIKESIGFAFSRLPQMFLSEITVGGFIGFAALLFALYGLVSRIPFIGDWVYAILFVIPSFVISILIIFAAFVLSLMFVLLPAVAAADRKGETFGAIVESFSTVLRQPARWFGWTAYSVVIAKLASFVYAYFCFRAVQFMVGASMIGGGESVYRLVKSGLGHLPVRSDFARGIFSLFPGVDISFSVDYWSRVTSGEPVSYLMAIMLFLIFASVVGYFLTVIATVQAHLYVMIRREKDNYDIADEDPMFFEDPWANPEIDAEDSSDPGSPAPDTQ